MILELLAKVKRRFNDGGYLRTVDGDTDQFPDHQQDEVAFNADLDAIEAEIHKLLAERKGYSAAQS